MPEIDFTPENKKTSTFEFDRFKLKKGERARVVLLEKPTFAWVHNLRAPQLVNGKAVKTTKERRNKNGEVIAEYEDWMYDFIGRPLCLGDLGTLKDKGLDPDHCPACKRARDGEQVNPPERRFACNLIKYALTHDGKLANPFSCACHVWSFNEGAFNKLLSIAEEFAEAGGLIGKDLLMGPCINESYQNFEITTGAKNVWQLNEDVKARVLETYRENKASNLEAACGRQVERRWMENDLDTVSYRYAVANGTTVADKTPAEDGPTLTEGLDDLMTATAMASNADPVDMGALLEVTPPATGAVPLLDDLADLDTVSKQPPPVPPVASADAFDFESVLGGI